jgi:hypothetical protein
MHMTGAALLLPALYSLIFLEKRRMTFTPKFVDLVRNYTSTVGTGPFVLGPAVNGFVGFAGALQPGEQFYYSAIGVDKPDEHEVGRGILEADGTIGRSPINGSLTNFSSGTKTIAVIAAAEWFNLIQSGGAGTATVASKSKLAAAAATQGAVLLSQSGAEGLFVFDGSDLSAEVAADARQGIHIAPESEPTGASGAWVRADRDSVNAFWFMTEPEVADVRAFGYTQNVTDALRAASGYIEKAGGGTLLLPKGGYLVGQQTFNGTALDGVTAVAYAPEEIITIKNCDKAVKISGYGAVLKAANGLRYGSFDPATGARYDPPSMPFLDYRYYGYPYRGMINVEGNASVSVEGVELDGNSANMIIGGYFGDSYWQLEGSGIWNRNNGSVSIRDVHSHHQPTDGCVTSQTGLTENSLAKPFTMENVRLLYNGRLGLALTGGMGCSFTNCDFSMTGQVMNASLGAKLQSTPGSGVDIEAEGTLIRNVKFSNCRFLGNWRRGLVAASGYSKGVTFENCTIESAVVSRFRYSFESCTFVGFTNFGIPLTNEYLPGTPATTADDGMHFHKCRFVYDDALSGTGTMADASRSLWDETNWCRFVDCSIDTATQLLPSVVHTLSESSPVFENTDWRSSNPGAVQINGFWRGQNNIIAAGPVLLDVGTNSRIDSGNIYLNGVGQASAPKVSDGDYGDVKVSGSGSAMTVESATLAASIFAVNVPKATDCNINLNGDAGQQKAVQFTTGGLNRWIFASDNVAESGSNAGSNFGIVRYDDAGGYLGYSLTIARSTGNATFNGNWNLAGGKAYQVNGIQVVGPQGAAVPDLTASAASGMLPSADGRIVISDAAAPTGDELLEYCVELDAKLKTLLARVRQHGLIA